MNNKDVQTFKPEHVMDKVKDKIKSSFVDLIPEDQWDLMIKKVINDWLKQKKVSAYRDDYQSDFDQLVRSCLNDHAKERVKEIIEEFQEFSWKEEGTINLNIRIEEMIIKNSGKILASIIGSTIQQVINNMSPQM